MDRPFPPPAKGEPLTAAYLAQLVDAIRASRIEAGPGLRAVRTPAGTTISLAPQEPSGKAPSLFDVKFKKSGNATHAWIYIGNDPDAIARFDDTAIHPYAAPTMEGGWMDVGAWTSSDSTIELLLVVASSDFTALGLASWSFAGRWCIAIDGDVPSGYRAHDTHRRVLFAALDDGWHKLCASPVQFSSRPCDTERNGATGTRYRSISTELYYGSVLQLYGFDDPTTATNPWASETPPTGIVNSDWMIVLRRKLSNGQYEIQYMPLAQVAGSPDGNGQPPSGGIEEAPEDGKNYGRRNGDWQNLDGEYWPQGGDESTCYGSGIGDSDGIPAIDLDNRTLSGSWAVDENLSVSDGVSAYSVSAESYVAIGSGGYIQIGTDHYSPKQITYIGTDGRSHAETILAKE